MKKIGITLLTACVGGAVAVGAYKLLDNRYADNLSFEEQQKVYFANNPAPSITSSAGELDFTQAAAAVTPAVVHIKTTYSGQSAQGGGGDAFGDMFEDFFGGRPRQQGPQRASGSGVIISPEGYIVTNNHVVEDADKIDVILPDNRAFEATVVGRDPSTDLALIKVSGNNLPILKLGNSDDVQVGEWVLAVGYPFALNTTVTAGIVSAKGRTIGILDQPTREQIQSGEPIINSAIESFIQTDAAINRGNSGGALVNTKGELIGINAAIASQSGSYEGYGFAIPVNLAKKIMDDFKKYGEVKRGYIGVTFDELDAEKAKKLDVKSINGLYVNSIVPGSGGEAVGIQKGDIITKVDGRVITNSAVLQERVASLRPGDKVQLTYLRDGNERTANVTLKGDAIAKSASSNTGGAMSEKMGATFAPATSAQKSRYNISSGLVVTGVEPDGFFDQMELQKGTIIVSINGRAINKQEDIAAAMKVSRNGMALINAISPDGSKIRYQFQVR